MKLKEKVIEIHRDELYEQVWKLPVSRLAPKYGISDVGLSKICRKLKVPKPPRGYWTKIQFGKKVRQTPLIDVKKKFPLATIKIPVFFI
jgi:hypothetical protein